MNSFKSNPLKYLKLFSIIYFVANFVLRLVVQLLSKYSGGMTVASLFAMVLTYLPFVLFMVYIFACYTKNKHHSLLTTSYIVNAVVTFITLISTISVLKYFKHYTFSELIRYGYISNILNPVFSGIALVFVVFYIVNCISKFKYSKAVQTLVIIQFILGLISVAIGIITSNTVTFTTVLSWLASITSLLPTLTYYIFWKYGILVTSTTPTENALYNIKKQLDDGKITEQEYNQRKTEILNKL